MLMRIGFLFCCLLSGAWAQTVAESVRIQDPVDHDFYAAGRYIDLLAAVEGDLTAAGQVITILDRVQGDVNVAGEIISVRAELADDLRAVGRQVTLSGPVAGHMVAAGERIILEPGSRLGGWAWLAGDSVSLSGTIGDELKVAAREVQISGEVSGDAEIIAARIVLLAGAHLHGNLIWHGESPPLVADGATIDGEVIARPLPPSRARHKDGSSLVVFGYFSLSLITAGIVLYLLFPRASTLAATTLLHSPWKALGGGVLVLLMTPLAVLLLLLSVIGSLLGLALLAGYLTLLLAGILLGTFAIGRLGLRLIGKGRTTAKGWQLAAFVLAMLLLGALQLVPVVGGVVELAVLLWGMGGLMLATRSRYREPAAGGGS